MAWKRLSPHRLAQIAARHPGDPDVAEVVAECRRYWDLIGRLQSYKAGSDDWLHCAVCLYEWDARSLQAHTPDCALAAAFGEGGP